MKRLLAALLVATAAAGCSSLQAEWDKLKSSSASGSTVQPEDPSPYPPDHNFGGT